MQAIKNISVLTLGCAKNVVDSENLIGLIEKNGFKHTFNVNKTDAVIINTCGFISSSKEESVRLIYEIGELRKRRKIKKLIVFGCFVQRYQQELTEQIGFVDHFYGIGKFPEILSDLKKAPELVADRFLLTPPHSAYLKISEGCDHRCAFCAIPNIRGEQVSRPIEELVAEAQGLVARGVKEINVIAQDTTAYGKDIYGKQSITELVQRLSDINDLQWLRVLYTYPVGFPMDLLKVMAERENIVKYLDMPLQHISDPVLKAMGRGISGEKTRELVKKIREQVPSVALRTTFIVGFHNETEADFEQLYNFVGEARLDRVGAFVYSPEDGTPAFDSGDPISPEIKQDRMDRLMTLQNEISLENNQALIGKTIKVLIDEHVGNDFIGRTYKDAPDVDNSVIMLAGKKELTGEFVNVKIDDAEEYDLFGEIV